MSEMSSRIKSSQVWSDPGGLAYHHSHLQSNKLSAILRLCLSSLSKYHQLVQTYEGNYCNKSIIIKSGFCSNYVCCLLCIVMNVAKRILEVQCFV